jgi:hypothetical protein
VLWLLDPKDELCWLVELEDELDDELEVDELDVLDVLDALEAVLLFCCKRA